MSQHSEWIDFAGNDYLGLARDVRLADAAHRAAVRFGISATSSRWGLGWSEVHEQLETSVAEFLGSEAACLISSAFLGGMVYFLIISERSDTVFCDEFSHTNLMLGMKAAGLHVHTYPHLNTDDLSRQLNQWSGTNPVIASDTVFGHSGELAPLRELQRIARTHDAELLLDDAHGVFAFGQNGRGAVEECGLSANDATILGSMSKALGSGGGFLAGRTELVERFRRSGPSTAATPLPIPIAAAALEAIRIVRDEPVLRENLASNAETMRNTLMRHGIGLVSNATPIIAMTLRGANEAKQLSAHLLTHRIRVPYFNYPADPRDNLLRSVARSCYTSECLERFGSAIASFDK